MPSLIYNSFRRSRLSLSGVSLERDTIKVMLVSDSYKPDRRHATTADVRGEVEGTGYIAGGAELTGKAITEDSVFDADDVTWPASTISARGCVLYGGGTGDLICYLDFDVNRVSMAGKFMLVWDAAGIITLDDGEG